MFHIPVLMVLALGVGLAAAGYGASRALPVWLALFCGLILLICVPLGTYLLLMEANRHAPEVAPSVLRVILTWVSTIVFVLGGLLFGWRRGRTHRGWRAAPRDVLSVLGGFAGITLGGYGIVRARQHVQNAEQRAEVRRENRQQWHAAERDLATCAATLTAALGRHEAAAHHRDQDRRLYAVIRTYQESQSVEVPGIVTSIAGFRGPYMYADGRAPGDRQPVRYGIERSPKGQLWSDPWGWSYEAMGREPPSAPRCDRATLAYVGAYNAEILKLGALTKPLDPPSPVVIPLLGSSDTPLRGFSEGLYPAKKLADYLDELLAAPRKLSSDGQSLTWADVERERARMTTSYRQLLGEQLKLYDRDGDEILSLAEIRRIGLSPSEVAHVTRALFGEVDLDRDQRITIEEINRASYEPSQYDKTAGAEALFESDIDNDGRLRLSTLTGIGRRAFRGVDTDKNGVISDREFSAKRAISQR